MMLLPYVIPVALFLGLVGYLATPVHPAPEPVRPSFVVVDVIVTTEGPLAAWQVFVTCASEEAALVGVENGDVDAFPEAPHYDPAALRGHRIVLADYSLADPTMLPSGRCRLASLHFEIPSGVEPVLTAQDVLCADADGVRLTGSVFLEIRR